MIGVFDSGVGGLSVLSEAIAILPNADFIYVADRGRAPYGPKPLEEVEEIAHDVTDWLVESGADCVVVACNTASAAALESIRSARPGLAVVGMEPAVKPAAEQSVSGTVAVFATAATFQGKLFNSVVERFASDVEVLTRACPEWVELVEAGEVDGPRVETVVSEAINEAISAGADRIVLACTHFSFLTPVIERLSGITVVDPAPAVARQVSRVAPSTEGDAKLTLAASGDTEQFSFLASKIAAISRPVIPFP